MHSTPKNCGRDYVEFTLKNICAVRRNWIWCQLDAASAYSEKCWSHMLIFCSFHLVHGHNCRVELVLILKVILSNDNFGGTLCQQKERDYVARAQTTISLQYLSALAIAFNSGESYRACWILFCNVHPMRYCRTCGKTCFNTIFFQT